jgi:hypothetical protein
MNARHMMMSLPRLGLLLAVALPAVPALAEDPPAMQAQSIVLEPVVVRNAEECQSVMAEFAWFCAEFERAGWGLVNGLPFWERGNLGVFRFDLDQDGLQDVVVQIDHYITCGSSGCMMTFVFADLPEPVRPWSYWISGMPPELELLVATDQVFLRLPRGDIPLSEIKESVVESPQRGLGG